MVASGGFTGLSTEANPVDDIVEALVETQSQEYVRELYTVFYSGGVIIEKKAKFEYLLQHLGGR